MKKTTEQKREQCNRIVSLIIANDYNWADRLYRFTQYILANHKDLIVKK